MIDEEATAAVQHAKALMRLQTLMESRSDAAFDEVAREFLAAFKTMSTEARLALHEELYMMVLKLFVQITRSGRGLTAKASAQPTTKPA